MPNLTRSPKQGDLFQVHHTFFVFISALAFDGTLARIQKACASSLAVLCCLKAAADFQTGLVSIGMNLLAKQSGCSTGTIWNAVAALEKEGLLEVVRAEKGKRHIYRLFDKLAVKHQGEDAGSIKVPFLPRQMKDRLQDIQSFSKEGELPPRALAAGVAVNLNIQVNITNNYLGDVIYNTTSEVHENIKSLEQLPNGVGKAAALRALKGQIERMEKEVISSS